MPPDDEDEFNFETVSEVFRKERGSAKLTKLKSDFYRRLAGYRSALYDAYMTEYGKNPTSRKAQMLNDEYTKVTQRSERIYEHRERKIALLALARANGTSPDLSPLTPEESETFASILEALRSGRSRLLDNGESAGSAGAEESAVSGPRPAPPSSAPASPAGNDPGPNRPPVEAAASADPVNEDEGPPPGETLLVRVLEDMPPFVTPDRDLHLRKEDVITLPVDVANILISNGKARAIERK